MESSEMLATDKAIELLEETAKKTAHTLEETAEKIAQTLEDTADERVVRLFKRAMDEIEILSWNGQAEPEMKPIGKAISNISKDLRTTKERVDEIKIKVDEHASLLEGIGYRKKVFGSIAEAFGYARTSAFGQIVKFGTLIALVYGAFHLEKAWKQIVSLF